MELTHLPLDGADGRQGANEGGRPPAGLSGREAGGRLARRGGRGRRLWRAGEGRRGEDGGGHLPAVVVVVGRVLQQGVGAAKRQQ